jgi:hypothetical protein
MTVQLACEKIGQGPVSLMLISAFQGTQTNPDPLVPQLYFASGKYQFWVLPADFASDAARFGLRLLNFAARWIRHGSGKELVREGVNRVEYLGGGGSLSGRKSGGGEDFGCEPAAPGKTVTCGHNNGT